MGSNYFTDNDIRSYLLGRLPSDTAEEIDELSFSDEYWELIGGVERDLVDNYVNGELPSDEFSAFEKHYLLSPKRRQGVEFAHAFQAYDDRSRIPAERTEIQPERVSFLETIRDWRRILQFGLATAGLIVAVVIGLAVLRSGTLIGTDVASIELPADPVETNSSSPTLTSSTPAVPIQVEPQSADEKTERTVAQARPIPTPAKRSIMPPKIATVLLSPALRGASVSSVKLAKDTVSIDFRLGLEVDNAGPFRVQITDLRGSAVVWSTSVARASGREGGRAVNFRAPSRILQSGEYMVSIMAIGQAGELEKVGDYYFRVAP